MLFTIAIAVTGGLMAWAVMFPLSTHTAIPSSQRVQRMVPKLLLIDTITLALPLVFVGRIGLIAPIIWLTLRFVAAYGLYSQGWHWLAHLPAHVREGFMWKTSVQ